MKIIKASTVFLLGALSSLLLAGCSSSTFTAPTPGESQWVWMGGSNTTTINGSDGSYGVQKLESPTNIPPTRDSSSSWTDTTGNFWLFGGEGYAPNGPADNFNDLWVFDVDSQTWGWVSGADTPNAVGVYGTQGMSTTTNVPGARKGAASWRDNNDNFWLFGGDGNGAATGVGVLNDLWEFNPTTQTWVWINGASTVNTPGVYGTQGVAAATNAPSARQGAVSWTDASGNLWLFGGQNTDTSTTLGYLNDLWEFNPATNTWMWVSGASTVGAMGVYGTQGTAAAANVPGARIHATSWVDSSGNFWLFGGEGYDSAGTQGYLNDLWTFNPTTKMWTWVSGANTVNAMGAYGTLNTAATTNAPGARASTVSWKDTLGNFWLYGGVGVDSTGAQGYLDDLWVYSATAKTWTWVSGANTVNAQSIYGTQGMPSAPYVPVNTPGGRASTVGWVDNLGNLWLFGGLSGGPLGVPIDHNDLWAFQP